MTTEELKKQIGGGLRKPKKDVRDFHYGAVFGQVPVEYIPDTDFDVATPLVIKDQKDSDLCTAYALTAVSEDQEEVELSPEWLFAKIKQIAGDPAEWGADPRDACKAATGYGFLEQAKAPYTLKDGRDFVADHKNWDDDLDGVAYVHHKKSYFRVDTGSYDVFDNIRGALHTNRAKKCTVFTGCLWRPAWTPATGGVIPLNYATTQGFGHAFKIFGQKRINGQIYLKAQLSNSKAIGDAGIFYFPREVVNREFTFGAWMFLDADPNVVKKENWGWWQKVVDWFRKLLKI